VSDLVCECYLFGVCLFVCL